MSSKSENTAAKSAILLFPVVRLPDELHLLLNKARPWVGGPCISPYSLGAIPSWTGLVVGLENDFKLFLKIGFFCLHKVKLQLPKPQPNNFRKANSYKVLIGASRVSSRISNPRFLKFLLLSSLEFGDAHPLSLFLVPRNHVS